MRILGSFLLCAALAVAAARPASAQPPARAVLGQTPIVLSMTLPVGKPPVTTRGFLLQTGAGMLGGAVAATAVALPLAITAWGTPINEAVLIGLIGGAYFAGTVAGIHYAGHRQGMRGNPWATTAGIVGGMIVSGAAMQPFIDDEGDVEGPAPLLVFVLPSVGGTAGYALTRQVRR